MVRGSQKQQFTYGINERYEGTHTKGNGKTGKTAKDAPGKTPRESEGENQAHKRNNAKLLG